MTEAQFYAVAGALRELLVQAGHEEDVLFADDVVQRLALPGRGKHQYLWDLGFQTVDGTSFDPEALARTILDEYEAQTASVYEPVTVVPVVGGHILVPGGRREIARTEDMNLLGFGHRHWRVTDSHGDVWIVHRDRSGFIGVREG